MLGEFLYESENKVDKLEYHKHTSLKQGDQDSW